MNRIKEIEQESVFMKEIKKSKFIAHSFIVHSIEEVSKKLDYLKKQYGDATHICYAYSILPSTEKAFDDGEPQGTAGKPILDCIKKNGVNNIFVAVVRCFGGVKLGAGGLVRAYSGGVSGVIDLSGQKVAEKCEKISFCVELFESKYIAQINNIDGVKNVQTKYGQNVEIDAFCKEDNTKSVINNLKNIFNREINISKSEETFYL